MHNLKDKKFFIFDMDGTIYLGESPLPNAINFIEKINKNKRLIFFTNNASKNPAYYLEKLKNLGFPEDIQVLTSADVLIKFLKNHRKGKKIYLLGTPYLESMFRQSGINIVGRDASGAPDNSNPIVGADSISAHQQNQHKSQVDSCQQNQCKSWADIESAPTDCPDIVVTSFDTTLTYDKLERACTFIRNGAEWLTTHPDINCPVENGGYIPDCGAINALISVSTGKPLPKAFGKPYGEVIDMIEEIYGEKRQNMAMFGDRLYTDIALGKKNGVTAVLLLTGEGTLEDAQELPEDLKPDFIFKDLFECERYFGE